VGWKEEEVTGWMVQECKWLSAKPADKTAQKPTRTRISKKWRKPRNSQNKERQTKMHKTRISQRSRQMLEKKKVRTNKIANKTVQAKAW